MNFNEAKDSSCIINGKLTIEFKEIIKNIKERKQRVSPDKLKNVMGKINKIYFIQALKKMLIILYQIF